MTLRFLSGPPTAIYLGPMVCEASVCNVVHNTLRAIDRGLDNVRFPTRVDLCEDALKFKRFRLIPIDCIIAALDGIAMKIFCLCKGDARNSLQYLQSYRRGS